MPFVHDQCNSIKISATQIHSRPHINFIALDSAQFVFCALLRLKLSTIVKIDRTSVAEINNQRIFLKTFNECPKFHYFDILLEIKLLHIFPVKNLIIHFCLLPPFSIFFTILNLKRGITPKGASRALIRL